MTAAKADGAELTAADRALLRSVFAWARANGWRRWRPDEDSCNDKTFRDWHWCGPDREVFLEVSTFRFSPSTWRLVARIDLDSGIEMGAEGRLDVRHAVDVFAGAGVLPVELSSAYRAGYGQGRDDEAADDEGPGWEFG
jgi:hypothetical protein